MQKSFLILFINWIFSPFSWNMAKFWPVGIGCHTDGYLSYELWFLDVYNTRNNWVVLLFVVWSHLLCSNHLEVQNRGKYSELRQQKTMLKIGSQRLLKGSWNFLNGVLRVEEDLTTLIFRIMWKTDVVPLTGGAAVSIQFIWLSPGGAEEEELPTK